MKIKTQLGIFILVFLKITDITALILYTTYIKSVAYFKGFIFIGK